LECASSPRSRRSRMIESHFCRIRTSILTGYPVSKRESRTTSLKFYERSSRPRSQRNRIAPGNSVPFASQGIGEQSAKAGAGTGDENHLLEIHSHPLVVISEASLKRQFDAGSTEVGVSVGSHTRSSEREAAKTHPAAIALRVLPRLHRSPVAGKSEYLPAVRRLNL